MVAAQLADGLFADVGLPEDVDDLRLAEPALAHRIRSFAWADSPISGGPVSGVHLISTILLHESPVISITRIDAL